MFYNLVKSNRVYWKINENEYSHPTKNVKNGSDNCTNENKLSSREKDKNANKKVFKLREVSLSLSLFFSFELIIWCLPNFTSIVDENIDAVVL